MSDEKFNGWANKPTWLANMYLQGNYDGEATYRETLAIVDRAARQAEPETHFSLEQVRVFAIARALEDRFEA